MLIAVGLIQRLCKSKAISHLQQHLGIRSTAGKYSETNSSFSRITSGVCEVPATSAKAFLTSARVHWRTGLPALQQVALTLGVGSGGVAGPQDQPYRTFAPHLTVPVCAEGNGLAHMPWAGWTQWSNAAGSQTIPRLRVFLASPV